MLVGRTALEFLSPELLVFNPTDWTRWRLWRYPTRVTITAIDASGRWRLALTATLVSVMPISGSPVIIIEAKARYDGELSRREGADWIPHHEIHAEGFFEWTDKWTDVSLCSP